MRTAVVRVGVDQAGELAPEQLRDGMARLHKLAGSAGFELVDNDLAGLPPQASWDAISPIWCARRVLEPNRS